MHAAIHNEAILKSAFDILCKQCDKLKYGCEEFVSSESFVEHFFANYDKEFLQYVDT